ncbi:GMC family oxidoreductase N-terminal domain-containing protein [Granulicella arctica]|uniref:GMC family oxidoreductase N-terminal domain-containing protein n=1 Tax=Granulicella arctica TaxID=940613 RepID=UPI0021E04124|nr:GMC family oxidoreductase N-terminal domain-containing protein [Granulicella arctica]
MQSGISDEDELRTFGIKVQQHLPGVGRNLHDHIALALVWKLLTHHLRKMREVQAWHFGHRSTLNSPNFYTYVIGTRS